MEFYMVDTKDNYILLKKSVIDLTDYNVEKLDNGDIKLTDKYEYNKIDIEDVSSHKFGFSKINKVFINNKKYNYNKYKLILLEIYNYINDGAKIIKNTTINIKTKKIQDKGFHYYENLGISIQGVDADKCIQEIITQAKINNIKVELYVTLNNGESICINI